jgi:hypothetical protein
VNGSALLAVQTALYTALTSDVTLSGLAGIYDEVPEGVTFPYIVIGDAVETPANAHNEFGSRVAATIHAFSEYRGYAELLPIIDRLMSLLDHQALTIAGRDLVAIRHEQTVLMRDPDPDVRHAVVRFSFETFDA